METIKSSPERPTFLTILCILSFVGLGMTVLNSMFTMIAGSAMTPVNSLLQSEFEMALDDVALSDPAALPLVEGIFEALSRLFEMLSLYGALTFFLAGIALAGAILMWNLKKLGFYLYVAGKVVLVFLPFILLGNNFLSMIMAFTSFIGAALFITLYGVNLKHLA